jgi:hypothetical protein
MPRELGRAAAEYGAACQDRGSARATVSDHNWVSRRRDELNAAILDALFAEHSEMLALLQEVQLAPIRADGGRVLVTLELDTLRRIAAAIGATPGDQTPDPVARNR